MRTWIAASTASVILSAGLAAAPAAVAAPLKGECYLLTDAQRAAAEFASDAAPVDCTSPHNIQILAAGSVPAGNDAGPWTANRCSWKNVNRLLHVNAPVKGVIEHPLRVTPFYFTDGTSYQCGAGVFRLMGPAHYGAEELTTTMADLIAKDDGWLRTCYLATKGRLPNSNPVSVACGDAAAWMTTAMVDLRPLGKGFPGQARITTFLKATCPSAQYLTWPVAKEWARQGGNYGTCYAKLPRIK
jgi:hypothetical protein